MYEMSHKKWYKQVLKGYNDPGKCRDYVAGIININA